jgi:hypothetical protein
MKGVIAKARASWQTKATKVAGPSTPEQANAEAPM